ncbi:hypothetical protein [Amycolatopsis regifaucium]|uniref:Uncharacterized protein n=1 Tax=Amycolatopsis regifaucium TaxID=546365 RepID=A0A154M5U2_9PSEU|nr:hypothetical protein [Amycolatopsis regifaucium]KZB79800.1 hypothetical protein AVL48_15575 [Amycolatopsis regifaucium]OKA09882.1 hypothetical protein ATP06_0205835 [Amycolatopsis regifaucium]SFI71347.1 hypothetical protein SAMN04489731_112221 [Amycolatopsis regifaucium]
MNDLHYQGSGPYCYTHSLSMMLGSGAPGTAVLETLTGSPFGMQLVGGALPFFDPFGWDPEIGIGDALAALGWTADTVSEEDPDAAFARLAEGLADGPVMIGPVEMGHLRYQPGMTGPIGADHYLVALAVDSETVTVHDPQGYPYARLPRTEFAAAWRAETVAYGKPHTLRTNFVPHTVVDEDAAIVASLPRAAAWLGGENGAGLPPGSLGNADAALSLAERIEAGLDADSRGQLVHFAVRVGARRLADAAACLRRVDHGAAAEIAATQARSVGSLQYDLVAGNDVTAAATLRTLAPTYEELRRALTAS